VRLVAGEGKEVAGAEFGEFRGRACGERAAGDQEDLRYTGRVGDAVDL
jgi:hypothetical protein